jgi:hypothetical protein
MAKRKKRPRDINQLAKALIDEATGQAQTSDEPTPDSDKNPAAVALGRLGGLKGGKARAKKLTPRQRSEIAKRAAETRWKKKGG